MPELPEVETVRKSLLNHILNRKIISIDILYPNMIKTDINSFKPSLENAKVIDIQRIGKFLIFIFDNNKVLISHLRMEGKYYYYNENEKNSSHARIVFHLDNNEKMIYDDTRKFGIMEVHNLNDYKNAECLAKLGKEPFDADENYLFNKIHHLKCDIKTAILDQTILTGIGNIYADETLFASKINPFRKANSITLEECKKIIINSRNILNKAILEGGSTVSSYHPENGVDGKFQLLLNAYGRNNLPCKVCSCTMHKGYIGGRGTVYCPHCQNVCLSIGIYGKIASGKSEALKYCSSLGYKVFSCDECVNKLYTLLETKKFVINLFGEASLTPLGGIDKHYIKNQISSSIELKTKLENYLYPLIKEEIKKFINENKEEKLIFIEVPLMFESKFNTLVDYIIGIDASYPTQIKNLLSRGSKTPDLDLKLNQNNQFDKYASKCDYLIHNNSSLEDFHHKLNQTINKILLMR